MATEPTNKASEIEPGDKVAILVQGTLYPLHRGKVESVTHNEPWHRITFEDGMTFSVTGNHDVVISR